MDGGSGAEGVPGRAGLGGRACMGPMGTVTETVPRHMRDEALHGWCLSGAAGSWPRVAPEGRQEQSPGPSRGPSALTRHGWRRAGGLQGPFLQSDLGSRSCAWSPAGVPALVLHGPRAASWGQVQPCG